MESDGLPNSVVSACRVGIAGPGAGVPIEEFQAIWDTGASISVITQGVVERCGLQPIGMALMRHAGNQQEPEQTEVYLINLGLPNNVTVEGVEVIRGGFDGGDVLIGMDIINAGDFALTHAGGGSKFSFRIPSQADIDFVRDAESPPPNRAARRARKRRRS